nr:molybdopterin cofactor-binding domain-containing protein [Tissierella sp.]
MKLDVVGQNIIRVDALSKVTGKAQYPSDMYMDGMLYGKTIRSTIPHAYVELDPSDAEKTEGIVKIFTHKDVPNNCHGVVFKDHEVFTSKKVKQIGDALAFIVGESVEACKAAEKKMIIKYEELEGIFDPEQAMKEDSPRVHEGSNIMYHYKLRRGDIEEGFKNCEVIAENTYKTHSVDHAFIQPEAGLSYVDEDGTLTLLVATQYPHFDKEEIANALEIDPEKVRIINTNIGGAFGGREDISLQIHLSLAAWTLNRPIKCIFDREESFLAHSKRHPMIMKYKTGADKDGNLLALEVEIIGDTGAYASWATNVLRKGGVHATGPYEIPNVKVDSYAVYTNNPYSGAMRGFGATQIPVAHEQQMDILAEELGMDPIEIRMKNIFRKGSETATGQLLLESVPLDVCLEEAGQRFKGYRSGKEEVK